MALNTLNGKSWVLASLEDTRQLANTLAASIQPGDLLLLDGPVGAGKTTLSSMLLEALGADTQGQSPSYALHRVHGCPRGQIHHFDLYRLETTQAFESLDPWSSFEEAFLSLVEWPFQIPVAWPPEAVTLTLAIQPSGKRNAMLRVVGHA